MSDLLRHISTSCFGASYLLAFGCELARTRWPSVPLRWVALGWAGVGLFTHSVFLAVHHPSPAAAYGATLAVAWVLAVFSLYGSLHTPRRAWAVFILPMVVGLVALAVFAVSPADKTVVLGDKLWAAAHGVLVLLSAVGVCVGCIASVMYLIQADRLRRKLNPLGGLHLLSLERLEQMNRRAITLAFPLLTVGLLLGAVLLRHYHDLADNWWNLKVLGTVGLWVVFGLLLYLRYSVHVSGRRLAWLTIAAFGLMLAVLLAAHPFAGDAKAAESEGQSRSRFPLNDLLARRASEGPIAVADGREATGRGMLTVLSNRRLAPRSRVGLTGGRDRLTNLAEVSP
jgi:ABC-type transport system involved in cytochrome c biogenesis permease subunit